METLARLRLISKTRSAAHVTERLGIEPSSAHEIGDPVRNTDRIYGVSTWYLESASEIEDVELADSLCKLLDKLEPVAAHLWQLEGEGYWVNWPCIVGTHGAEHMVEMDRHTLQRLLALPGDLWLDFMESVPEDLEAAAEKWSLRMESGGTKESTDEEGTGDATI